MPKSQISALNDVNSKFVYARRGSSSFLVVVSTRILRHFAKETTSYAAFHLKVPNVQNAMIMRLLKQLGLNQILMTLTLAM